MLCYVAEHFLRLQNAFHTKLLLPGLFSDNPLLSSISFV